MSIPLRILRADADNLCRPTRMPTLAEGRTKDRIRKLGRNLLGNYGRAALTTGRLASSLNISVTTFRRHWADIDVLLADLICDELRHISRLFAEIPRDTPDRQAVLRAKFLDATRHLGALAEGYRLIVRDLPLLPDDLRGPIERMLFMLGTDMAGPRAEKCLALMALLCLTPADIENALAVLETPPEQAATDPANAPEPNQSAPQPPPGGSIYAPPEPISLDVLAAARTLSKLNARPRLTPHKPP